MGKDKSIITKMRLDYLWHLWKAKGRHGTHSPFVYAFVERVLRDRQPLLDFENKQGISFPGLNRLLKTVSFLETETLVLFQPHLLSLKPIFSPVCRRQNLTFADKDGISTTKNTLVLIDTFRLLQEDLDYLKHRQSEHPFALYFLAPHINGRRFKRTVIFKDWKNYPMSLDFWNGLLLYQHPDFKQKQHFLLR